MSEKQIAYACETLAAIDHIPQWWYTADQWAELFLALPPLELDAKEHYVEVSNAR